MNAALQTSRFAPVNLFTYGTLMRGKGNHHLMLGAEFLGTALTQRAVFGMINVGFPMVTEAGVGQVRGEMFRVRDPHQLARVDALEGHPTWYERKEFNFLLTNNRTGETYVTKGWMYVMPEKITRNRGDIVNPNENGHLIWPGAMV